MLMLGNKSCYEIGNMTAKQVAKGCFCRQLSSVYVSLIKYFDTEGCTCLLHEMEKYIIHCIVSDDGPRLKLRGEALTPYLRGLPTVGLGVLSWRVL